MADSSPQQEPGHPREPDIPGVHEVVETPSQWVNVPNALTTLRLVLVPVFAWLLMYEDGDNSTYRYLAAIVFIIASVTDFFDGYLARKQGLETAFGKIADPLADKALTGVALVGLSLLGELPWWATIIILGREIAVTVLRFWVIRHGVIPASRGGKAKTVSQMLLIVLYILPLADGLLWLRTVVLWLAVALTVITGLDYIGRAINLRRNSARTAAKDAARDAAKAADEER